MKSKLLALLGLGILSVLSVRAETFVRPVAYYVHPTAEGYDDNGAAGLAVGRSFGAQSEHELSFEIAYTRWTDEFSGYGAKVSGNENYLPLLANYRFYAGSKQDKVRAYVGPSLGFTRAWVDIHGVASGQSFSISSGDWAFTYSGVVGAVVRLTDKLNLDFGYRYLAAEKTTYSAFGYSIEAEGAKAHMGYAALSCRF